MTDPTRVEIDGDGRGVLVAGEVQWTFDLDLASGTAVLATPGPDGEPVRVRGLRWREKLALARFGGLGDAFMTRALATTCATPRLPTGPDDAIVAALADWLEGPWTEAGMGRSDPARLAAITVELCRQTGLRPADLDELPAGEVVQLWSAAQVGAGVAVADVASEVGPTLPDAWAAGATRIEVIADPDSRSPERGGAPDRERDADERNGSSTEAGGDGGEARRSARTESVPETSVGGETPRPAAADEPDRTDRSGRPAAARDSGATRGPAVTFRRATSDPPTLFGGRIEQSPTDGGGTAQSPVAGAAIEPGELPAAMADLAEPGPPRPRPAPGQTAEPIGERPEAGSRHGSHGSPPRPSAPIMVDRDLVAPTRVPDPIRTSQVRRVGRAAPVTPPMVGRDPVPPSSRPIRFDPAILAVPAPPGPGGSIASPPRPATAVPQADVGRDGWNEPLPARFDEPQPEALFRALADALELATDELGIGSEA